MSQPADNHHPETRSSSALTYHELDKHFIGNEDSPGKLIILNKSTAVISNYRTALNAWRSQHSLQLTDPIGDEITINFDGALLGHIKWLEEERQFASNDLSRAKTFLKDWHEAWRELARSKLLPGDFYGAFREVIDRAIDEGIIANQAELNKSINSNSGRVFKWYKGTDHPSLKSMVAIQEIEKVCKWPKGTLTSLVKSPRGAKGKRETGKTKRSRKYQKLIGEKYKLNIFLERPSDKDFTDDSEESIFKSKFRQLIREWVDLFKFKTRTSLPPGMKRNPDAVWKIDSKTGRCGTSSRFRHSPGSFFGYLHNVSGIDIDYRIDDVHVFIKQERFRPEDLTLALMGQANLLEYYIENFMKLRWVDEDSKQLAGDDEEAIGEYTNTVTNVLTDAIGLLEPEMGYFVQHPEFSAKLPVSCRVFPLSGRRLPSRGQASKKEWKEWCSENLERCRQLRRDISRKVTKTLIEEPIKVLLKLEHPIQGLIEFADRVEANVPTGFIKEFQAVHYRVLLQIKLLTVNPLRVKHYSMMTCKEDEFDDTGNLYKTRDGAWWMWFPKDAFKNFKTMKQEEYRVQVHRSVWRYIETYRNDYRPFLAGCRQVDKDQGIKCDFLLRPDARQRETAEELAAPIAGTLISENLRRYSYLYIDNCPGFGAHAFRHIVATDYVRNNPYGHLIVASILHDTIKTVIERYTHIQTQDLFNYYNRYLDGLHMLDKSEDLFELLKEIMGLKIGDRPKAADQMMKELATHLVMLLNGVDSLRTFDKYFSKLLEGGRKQ